MPLDPKLVKLFGLPRFIEVRWLGKKLVSLFTSAPDCVAEAMAAPGVSELDCYILINQPMGDTASRRRAPLDTLFSPRRGQCTADGDIERRLLLPFDLDPVRPIGTAATPAQIALAVEMRDFLVSYLGKHGFPDPAGDVFSGNGAHTYYRTTDLSNSPEVQVLLYGLYTGLARKFDMPGLVKLDRSVRSPGQIMRLPGTFNHKAQRQCEIISVAETAGSVTLQHIQEVVKELRGEQGYKKPLESRAGDWRAEQMEALLDFHCIDYQGPREVPQGLLWILSPCPFNSDHVGSSPAVILTKSGWPKFCCKHDSCQGKNWRAFLAHLNITNGKVFSWTSSEFENKLVRF